MFGEIGMFWILFLNLPTRGDLSLDFGGLMATGQHEYITDSLKPLISSDGRINMNKHD